MNDNQLQQLLQAINTLQDLGKVAYFNKGAYNSETTYEINDVVTYQGSSYVSLGNNNQGNLPTNVTYWSVVALKGDKGDTGKPFVIEKTYISIQEMVADYDNMNVNDYVMISGSIEDEQNATLWTKTETPAPTYKWVYLADFSGASGITGQTPNIQIGNVTEGNEPAVTRRQGSTNENPILDFVLKTGAKGDTGATGNGISQVSKTSTSGLTDTYTIEYTSGNSTTFDVTNGKGITSIAKTGTSGLVDTYTITYNDGTTSTFTITNGEDGEVTQAQLDETNNQVAKANMVYNALPKVSDEGDNLTLDGTANCPMKMELKGNTETAILPSGYTQIEYLESTGTQYIDTGININTTTSRYETKINPSSVSGTMGIFGTRNYSSANSSAMNVFILSGTFRLDWLSGNGNYNVRNISSDTEYTMSITRGLATINNVDYTSSETSSIDSTYPFYVGNFNNAGSVSSTGFSGKIYYSKLYNNNILVFYGVPCYRNSDNEIGMYDLVSNTFFTNQGTGTFNAGPVVSIPSPSPDYPQDIRVVTGNNSVKVIGKNLINFPYYETTKTVNGITFTVKNDGTIHVQGTASARTEFLIRNKDINLNIVEGETYTIASSGLGIIDSTLWLDTGGETGSFLGRWALTQITTHASDVAQAKDIKPLLRISVANGATVNTDVKVWLYKGSYDENTTYEPYQSQTYPLNLGSIELCKIGDYQDYIYKDSGKWYKHSEICKVVLDGSDDENWTFFAHSDTTDLSQFILIVDNLYGVNNVASNKCNYFKSGMWNNYWTRGNEIFSADMTGLRKNQMFFTPYGYTDLVTWKTWLSSHNLEVYYTLATPTNEEITDTTLISQLNAIENSVSYDTQTNIVQENYSEPFIINAECVRSLKDIFELISNS